MIPTEIFILRRKTRPSEEEWLDLLGSCLKSSKEAWLTFQEGAKKLSNLKFLTASLNSENDDIEKQFRAFIIHEGGERYLNNTKDYALHSFKLVSGENEDTLLAIAYVRENITWTSSNSKGIENFIIRGQRWVELGHWGDSLSCYQIGLKLFPDHPDLLMLLGKVQMRYVPLLPKAVENLTKVTEQQPNNGLALYLLGKSYRIIAENHEIQIKGRSREELKYMALGFFDRALVLQNDNQQIATELESLKTELGLEPGTIKKSGFFE